MRYESGRAESRMCICIYIYIKKRKEGVVVYITV